MVFPKPPTALDYTYSMSDPHTYKKFVEDLKNFLKRKYVVLEEGGALVLHAGTDCLYSLFDPLFSPFQTLTTGKICR